MGAENRDHSFEEFSFMGAQRNGAVVGGMIFNRETQ